MKTCLVLLALSATIGTAMAAPPKELKVTETIEITPSENFFDLTHVLIVPPINS